jgi:hypothetical protein
MGLLARVAIQALLPLIFMPWGFLALAALTPLVPAHLTLALRHPQFLGLVSVSWESETDDLLLAKVLTAVNSSEWATMEPQEGSGLPESEL